MYCPVCGKENNEEQRFCRSCGLSLQPVIRAVKGETSPIDAGETQVATVSRAQQLWQNPFAYGLLLIVLGLTFEVIADKVLGSSKAADIGTLISILGVGLIGFKGVMLVMMNPNNPSRAKSSPRIEATSIVKPAQLPSERPSVTENTTRQLDEGAEILKERSPDTKPTS